jgi:hypothetical protein
MDEAGRNTTAFLESLQDAMRRLGEVWNHYQCRGTRPHRPYLMLSDRPFRVHEESAVREFDGSVAIGLGVRGTDGKDYQLAIDVLWDSERWTLMTQAWVDSDDGGQELLRELPERVASDTETCKRHLTEAVSDLLRFQDLVPGGAGAG